MVWEEWDGGVGGEGRWCGRRGKVVLEEREGGVGGEGRGVGVEGWCPPYKYDLPYP